MDQERLTNQDMESLGEEILKEKQSLGRELHTLRAEKDRQVFSTLSQIRQHGCFIIQGHVFYFIHFIFSKQISELESERQHLSEAVASLQERAQSNNEERVREVEAENRQLLQNITDTSSRLASLETQLKLANEEAARLKEKAERCEEVEREVSRLERSKDALSREVKNISTQNFSKFHYIETNFTLAFVVA